MITYKDVCIEMIDFLGMYRVYMASSPQNAMAYYDLDEPLANIYRDIDEQVYGVAVA